jgi:hypothetical protein
MKEIGKLIELLNEYRTEKLRREMYVNWADKEAIELSEAERINEYEVSQTLDSQNYLKSFVKWLVENDKIDREQFYDKARKIITDFDLRWEYEWACNEIIMLLSISDTPIEDLILYLK